MKTAGIAARIAEIQRLARSSGLKGQVRLVLSRAPFKASFDPRTRIIHLGSFFSRRVTCFALAHEIGHQVDFERYKISLPLLLVCYHLPIYALPIIWLLQGKIIGAVLVHILVRVVHPLEVSANLYAWRHWRDYYKVLFRGP